jgi:hypothetical protein
MNGKMWTDEDRELLRSRYADEPTEVIAFDLGRTARSVYAQVNLMGLKKSDAYLAKMALKSKLHLAGAAHRFAKGSVPANKGQKMPADQYAKAKATMFKKGDVPHNTKHDGAIAVRIDKRGNTYLWIRVGKSNWRMLHVHLWEEAHGAVPKGSIVVFKDKNTMHCKLENLEQITKAENMKRNTIHQYPQELKSTIKLLSKIKKTINEKQSN